MTARHAPAAWRTRASRSRHEMPAPRTIAHRGCAGDEIAPSLPWVMAATGMPSRAYPGREKERSIRG
jgi:hypothetical protein